MISPYTPSLDLPELKIDGLSVQNIEHSSAKTAEMQCSDRAAQELCRICEGIV